MRIAAIVLLACSGLLLGGGAILGASTAWALCKVSYLFWTSDLGLELGAAVTSVAAAVLCVPASWLAIIVPYNPRAYALHGTLMCLVMATMMLIFSSLQSASELSRAAREPTALNASMLQALARAPTDTNVRRAFDTMQLDHGEVCRSALYFGGCLRPVLQELRSFCNSMSVLSYCLILSLTATLFTTAYLLAASVIEQAKGLKPRQMRIACLSGMTPFTCVTSPVALSTPPAPTPAHVM